MPDWTDNEIMEMADRWHAPNCTVDAGGACVLDMDEKEAFVAGFKARDAETERLRHDLSWHYDEVAYLRGVIQKTLNTVLRPPALDWPGDEHPVVEASRILSDALKPNRRQQ